MASVEVHVHAPVREIGRNQVEPLMSGGDDDVTQCLIAANELLRPAGRLRLAVQ